MSVFYNPRLMWCVNTFPFTILSNAHQYIFSSISKQFDIISFSIFPFPFIWRGYLVAFILFFFSRFVFFSGCLILCHADRQTIGHIESGHSILLILLIPIGLKRQNYKTDETTSKMCQNVYVDHWKSREVSRQIITFIVFEHLRQRIPCS